MAPPDPDVPRSPTDDRRVMALFLDVVDAPTAERERILAAEPAAIRAQVERMCAHDAAPVTDDVRATVAAPLEPPDCVGSFRLLSVLGEGGMGRVYLAEQDLPRRRVAVKLLHPHLFGTAAITAFHAEVETLASLADPGLPWLIAAGDTDGWLWLAMERVHGQTLDVWARAASAPRRWSAVLGLCRIVGRAHARGIAHLDLKPANVLVDGDRVVLLDLGIARIAGAVGAGAGTPGWRAPEQQAGAPVDVRSDVYALGRMAHAFLPASPALATVLRRATSEAPEDRPATASALADALAPLGPVRPVAARPAAPATDRARSSAEVVLDRLLALSDPRSDGPADVRGTLRVLSAELDAGLLDGDPDAELRLRARLGLSVLPLDDVPLLRRQMEAMLTLLPEARDAVVRGEVHATAATVCRRLGQPERAGQHIEAADAALPPDHPARADLESARGYLAWTRGDLPGAVAAYRRTVQRRPTSLNARSMLAKVLAQSGEHAAAHEHALHVLEAQRARHGDVHFEVAVAWSHLGQLAYEAERYDDAAAAFARELDLMVQTVGEDNPRTAACRKWLAGTLTRLGRTDEALVHVRAAIAQQADDVYLGTAVQTLAGILLDRGELEAAEAEAERAIQLYRERLGDDFRALPRVRALLAEVRARRGDRAGARAILEDALPALHAIWGAGHVRARPAERLWAELSD